MALDHFDVTRATKKNVLNAQGVLAEVDDNVPAFKFNPDGTYKGCLIEPASTNNYINTDISSVGGSATTILGYPATTHTGFNLSASGGDRLDTNNFNWQINVGQTFVYSILVKVIDTNTISWWIADSTISVLRLQTNNFDVVNNTATFSNTTNVSNPFFGSILYGFDDGYPVYRAWIGGTISTSDAVATFGHLDTANGTTNAYAFPQLELGSVPTSLIQTTGTTATRNADEIVRTNASDLIGQDEGTLFFDVDFRSKDEETSRFLTLGSFIDGGISFDFSSTGALRIRSTDNGSTIGQISTSLETEKNKIAVVYTDSDFTLYINNTEINTEARTIVAMDDIQINGDFNAHLKTFALYKRALTQQEAESLTSL